MLEAMVIAGIVAARSVPPRFSCRPGTMSGRRAGGRRRGRSSWPSPGLRCSPCSRRKAAFLRTPKTSERTSWRHALRANWAETVLALFGAAGIACALTKTSTLSGPLLAGLLFVPTLGMAAAPFNSWAARRAALPEWLRQRRNTEYRRERHTFAAGASIVGAVAVGVVAALAIALM
ncbi:MAG TPA: hypothetical protein VIL16_18850, partial [Trebonia sp.]